MPGSPHWQVHQDGAWQPKGVALPVRGAQAVRTSGRGMELSCATRVREGIDEIRWMAFASALPLRARDPVGVMPSR